MPPRWGLGFKNSTGYKHTLLTELLMVRLKSRGLAEAK